MEYLQTLLDNSEIPIITAFLLGLLTAVSPCPLATNITAIGFISKDINNRNRIFTNGILYTLGRVLAYSTSGAILIAILRKGADMFAIQKGISEWGELLLAPALMLIGLFIAASATPISILTREILQYASTIEEAYAIARKRKTFVSESILVGSAKDGRAAIIEKSPEKIALFTGNGQQIICTNHYQSETFGHDKRNLENIETSDSPYRFARLQELLKENAPIDAPKAASILRNRKGVGEAELGLANEMAINQFIAHHSVIFQPEKKRMWVSTAPWQCGKYVAYDLNRIFSDSIDFNHEIYTENLTVPADSFLQQQEYQQLMTYKRLAPVLRKQIKKKERLDEQTLHAFQHANPHFFYVYELLGDYYHATGQQDKALRNWKKALLLPIPKRSESERIEHKINN